MRYWNFIKNAATETEPESIELRIEGDIVSDDDAWLYEWFGMPATSPNAFKSALAEHEGKDITVWVDSYGGDVFAAAGIYNALMEHRGKVTVKVDGKAMSAASVIAMAGGEIHMSPVAILMIHNPLTMAAGDAREMRHTADVLDAVKETIINAYQLKTNKSRNKIAAMMDDETWMSAKTAIKEGFADGMLYSETPAPDSVLDFSRHAVMNTATETMKKVAEFTRKRVRAEPEPNTDVLKAKLALKAKSLELFLL